MSKLFYGRLSHAILLGTILLNGSCAFAAKPIDLKHQPVSLLKNYLSSDKNNLSKLEETSSAVDFNQTKHIRLRQTYENYPVWGGDIVIHIPHGNNVSLQNISSSDSKISMNGILYQDMESDLRSTPNYTFNAAQMNKALQSAIISYQKKSGNHQNITQKKIDKIIYVDNTNHVHRGFLIRFLITSKNTLPQKPIIIMDAVTLKNYVSWNDLKTLSDTLAGGFGGNDKMGKLYYDGLKNNFPELNMVRDDSKQICYLKNSDVIVINSNNNHTIQFKCSKTDSEHNNVFWNASFDAVNGAYSPANDALYVGKVIKDMYQTWYGIPVLTENNKSMILNMQVHEKMDNAYWDGQHMVFGDGVTLFYPLVSLGVGAHEISHGFTEQHSNLIYYGQSGGLNESFSDMASQAATYFSKKTNNWMIGDDIIKKKNTALRYMDEPTKDCEGKTPGEACSISHMKDYHEDMDVHFSSGIFNKAFYLLANSKGWDTKKAFDVMVQANQYYWTATSNFTDAACGVLKAAKDYKYPVTAVKKSMKQVGIAVTTC